MNVYYQPEKVTEAKMLAMIRKGGCPNSRIIRSAEDSTTMNPYVAAGDTVQIRLKLSAANNVTVTGLPKGWVADNTGGQLGGGVHYLNIRTPKSTSDGNYAVQVKVGESVKKFPVSVVKLVR